MLGFIISPAKKMNVVEGPPYVAGLPRFMDRTQELMQAIQALSYKQAKELWRCSDKLAQLNYERFSHMDLHEDLTAAVIAYEGLQYQHLNPGVMSEKELAWLGDHLRILSGFYGVLAPFDGVVPYRLEMGSKFALGKARNLYEWWGPVLCDALCEEYSGIVNLASVEYSKAVTPWAKERELPVLTCLFGSVDKSGKLVQRSTMAKAARGCFVRWCAERNVRKTEDLKSFSERGYALDKAHSNEQTLAFVKHN
ncbi:MAG: peroxide stress protein YaaA [Coriobacteriales bacterium]|nr:peroxide stress protein YaaA [Coriobacteriales bacterium]